MNVSKYTASHRRHQAAQHTNESIAFARAYVETKGSTVGDRLLEVSVETSMDHTIIFQVDPNGTITLIPTPGTVQISRSFSSAQARS